MTRRVCVLVLTLALGSLSHAVYAATGDIVLYASDVTTVQGNWSKASASGAAESLTLSSVNLTPRRDRTTIT